MLQLQPDGRLLLQMDPPGLQLQEQLLRTDEAPLSSGVSSLLLQEEQEQLLCSVIILVSDVEKQGRLALRHVGVCLCVLLRAPEGSLRLPPTCF